jgi:hypothetical protein
MAYGLNAGLDIAVVMGSTNIIRFRVVRFTSNGTIVHTTGPSTATALNSSRHPFGVVQDGPRTFPSTQGKIELPVRVVGWTRVQASTKAIKAGQLMTVSSGAIGTTTFLGGCVKPTTAITQAAIGWALTTQAATATPGLVSVFLTPVR